MEEFSEHDVLLREVVWSIERRYDYAEFCDLQASWYRLKRLCCRPLLTAIYHMLSQKASYNDLGDLYLDQLNKHHLTRNLVHRLERLGYAVTLTPQEKAA